MHRDRSSVHGESGPLESWRINSDAPYAVAALDADADEPKPGQFDGLTDSRSKSCEETSLEAQGRVTTRAMGCWWPCWSWGYLP